MSKADELANLVAVHGQHQRAGRAVEGERSDGAGNLGQLSAAPTQLSRNQSGKKPCFPQAGKRLVRKPGIAIHVAGRRPRGLDADPPGKLGKCPPGFRRRAEAVEDLLVERHRRDTSDAGVRCPC